MKTKKKMGGKNGLAMFMTENYFSANERQFEKKRRLKMEQNKRVEKLGENIAGWMGPTNSAHLKRGDK